MHDFGAFSEDDHAITCQFRFINHSDSAVTILQAAASCGCTVPTYTTEPIAPGDTAAIDVRFNPVGQAGRFEKHVYVRTDATHERIKLAIKGAVIGASKTVAKRFPVDFGPLKLRNGVAMIGKVKQGELKQGFLDCYNASLDTIAPAFAECPAYLRVKSTPERIAPGEAASFSLFFDASKCGQWGMVTDSILIVPNRGEEPNWLTVVAIVEEDFSNLTPEQLQKAPKLSLSTDRVDLGIVEEHSITPLTSTIRLTNTGKEALKIRRAYSSDPGVSVKVKKNSVKSGKSTDLTVTFDPQAQPTGIINAKFTLITNDPTLPTRSIRVVGTRK